MKKKWYLPIDIFQLLVILLLFYIKPESKVVLMMLDMAGRTKKLTSQFLYNPAQKNPIIILADPSKSYPSQLRLQTRL